MSLFKGNGLGAPKGLYAEFKNERLPEYTGTNGKVGRSAREDIVVTSIIPGAGATYISAAIANYISGKKKGRTVLVGDAKDTYVESLLKPKVIHKKYPVEIQELYSTCDYMVQDIGCYQSLDNTKSVALARATTKVIICHADDDCMRKIAAFARERQDAERFYYLFNVLPKEWKSKVYRTMDMYEAYCLPLFNAKNPEKEVCLMFKKIFGR